MTKNFRNTLILFIIGIFATVVPAALIAVGAIDAYTAQIFSLAGINAIMALSVNIICGITGQLSLGQAGFMAIGGY
ncbi:MAG: branched-chain amino acid ABC transporter permease, partial [Treponema sp.]|nr:branched-chain amino acid ABC transporter permease [Treponema sp.]